MPTFQEIPLKDIVLSGDNQRTILEGDDAFKELKASIEAGVAAGGPGVRVPIIVRKIKGRKQPGNNTKDTYELRAGERRYRACKSLGLKTIPAVVHNNLDDLEALDLMYIENKFRENLKPMEEAAEVALLMERFGGSAKRIAEKIGKAEQWVRVRANIINGLIKPWKTEIRKKGESRFASWTISHLLQIARLPNHHQKELLRFYTQSWIDPEKATAADVEEKIARLMQLLSKAMWNLDDETLCPTAGACSQCTKRTGHQPMLWFDSDDQAEAGDQCLDPECWMGKQTAWLARRAKELRDKHPKLVLVAKGYPQDREAEAIGKNVGTYLCEWDYKVVKKSAKGAVPAMYVFGKGVGQLTYIQRKSNASETPKAKGVPTPLKERRAKLNAKRWAQVLVDMKDRVEKSTAGDITYKDKVTGLMAMVACYGNSRLWCAHSQVNAKDVEKLIKDKDGQAKALDMLWQSFIPTLRDELTWNGPITQTPNSLTEDAKWIAKLIGVDIQALFKDVSERKGFTEPKSWQSLNADGTPKKAKPKKTDQPKPMKKAS